MSGRDAFIKFTPSRAREKPLRMPYRSNKGLLAVSLQNGARKLFKIVTVHVICYLDFLVLAFFVQSVNYPLKKASFLLCRASGVLPGTRGHQAEDERQTCGYRVERLPVTQKVLCCVLIQGFCSRPADFVGFLASGFRALFVPDAVTLNRMCICIRLSS